MLTGWLDQSQEYAVDTQRKSRLCMSFGEAQACKDGEFLSIDFLNNTLSRKSPRI